MIGYLVPNRAFLPFLPVPARRSPRTAIRSRLLPMVTKLSDCFAAGEIVAAKGDLDRPITGIALDSRRVVPGNLFFALPGQRADGVSFIDEAISRGAAAVVAPRVPNFPRANVTFLQVADARVALARVAQRYYRFPDRDHGGDRRDRHQRQDHRHPSDQALPQRRPAGRAHRHGQLRPGRAHRAFLPHHARVPRHFRHDGPDARRRVPAGGHGSQFPWHRPAARARPAIRAPPSSPT